MKRSPVRAFAITLAVAIALSSCSMFGSPGSGDVTGEADPPVLILTNETGQIAHVVVLAQPAAARADIRFGDYRTWPAIEPGHTREIRLDDIAFYDESSSSVWVLWKSRDDDGSFDVSLR